MKVSYKRGATLNIGNYESVKVEVEAEAELEPGDTPHGVMEDLRTFVLNEIRSDAQIVRERVKARRNRE